jgi:hypothetical protein
MRAEHQSLRERVDKNHDALMATIGVTNNRIDTTNGRIDVTNEKLTQLDRKVTDIASKLTALLWVVGGLGSLITIAVTVGKALHWF